jgi:hypothetical protein
VPCGDGLCKPEQNENPQTCSTDCIIQGLSLASNSDTAARAVMFTATAIEGLSFTSFSFTASKTGISFVEIYTLVGDYAGNEQNPNAWTSCFSNNIQLVQDQVTSIDSLNCPTSTPTGSLRSFHILVKNGMRFEKGSSSTANSLLKVDKSVMMARKFSTSRGDALMTGEVK